MMLTVPWAHSQVSLTPDPALKNHSKQGETVSSSPSPVIHSAALLGKQTQWESHASLIRGERSKRLQTGEEPR